MTASNQANQGVNPTTQVPEGLGVRRARGQTPEGSDPSGAVLWHTQAILFVTQSILPIFRPWKVYDFTKLFGTNSEIEVCEWWFCRQLQISRGSSLQYSKLVFCRAIA